MTTFAVCYEVIVEVCAAVVYFVGCCFWRSSTYEQRASHLLFAIQI